MRVGITAVCALAMIGLTAPALAHADQRDDDFVNYLAGQGITGDPAKMVSTAHTVCTTTTQASSVIPGGLGQMMPMGYVMTTLRLNMGQINQFIDASKTTYCPPPAPPAPPAAVPAADGTPPPPGAPAPDAPPPAPGATPLSAATSLPSSGVMPALPGLSGIAGMPGMGRIVSAMGGTP